MVPRRDELLDQLAEPWDLVVIGGGATGVGVAVDAATRGYRVALLEQGDFGQGTSSRSTKLVHGGVRYLRQGDLRLVMESLRERETLRRNAPHVVRDLSFVVPCRRWWERPFYGLGLTLYDRLAARSSFGRTRWLSRDQTLETLPGLQAEGLQGGVLYHDGQFDDARLLIDLVTMGLRHGAAIINYLPVVEFLKREGRIIGVVARDVETDRRFEITAKVVINAAGPFCDAVRQLDDPATPPLIRPSQGAHVVLDASFWAGETALMVPSTDDGRVLFVIPWLGRILIGTTDTPVPTATLDPRPLDEEVDFLLEHAARYLNKVPSRSDVLSLFAGVRPLVAGGHAQSTAGLSRDFTLRVEPSGLLTITGGKWTTYRAMAEACVDRAARLGGLPPQPCRTRDLPIESTSNGADPARAARETMARTVEDVLARRSRLLFLDARAAIAAAPEVARALAVELRRDETWQADQVRRFTDLAAGFLPQGVAGD